MIHTYCQVKSIPMQLMINMIKGACLSQIKCEFSTIFSHYFEWYTREKQGPPFRFGTAITLCSWPVFCPGARGECNTSTTFILPLPTHLIFWFPFFLFHIFITFIYTFIWFACAVDGVFLSSLSPFQIFSVSILGRGGALISNLIFVLI